MIKTLENIMILINYNKQKKCHPLIWGEKVGFNLKPLAMLAEYSVEERIVKYIHIEQEAKNYKNKIDNISENVSFN